MIKDDAVYLRHILDAIGQIEEYVTGFDYEMFMRSRLVQDGEKNRVRLALLLLDHFCLVDRAANFNATSRWCVHQCCWVTR